MYNYISAQISGQVILAEVGGNEAIRVSDILIHSETKKGGRVIVKLFDGTNTVIVYSAGLTDAPLNMSINFSEPLIGWAGASLLIESWSNSHVTASAQYTLVEKGTAAKYADWKKI